MHKVKEMNEKIIYKALAKLEVGEKAGVWDEECFESMSQAIDNLLDLAKIEYYKTKEVKAVSYATEEIKESDTVFAKTVKGIISERGEDGFKAVMIILTELVEDVKILHPKVYEKLIRRLMEAHK